MFQFKQFIIKQDRCAMKVGTDGVLLGAWFDGEGAGTILDIGSGSGLIALMAAQRFPEAHTIHGVELDPEPVVRPGRISPTPPGATGLSFLI